MKSEDKIVVLGIGNLLLKDEGVGVHLLQELEKETLPPNVELIDGGTSTLNVLPEIKGAKKIIVIDAMKAGDEPGSIYRCRPKDLIPAPDAPMSLHHIDYLQALKMAKLLGYDLEEQTVIYGVEPEEISWEIGLSPRIKGKMAKLKALVLEEINKPTS